MSHLHVTNDTQFQAAYDMGFRHFSSSHYLPAHPMYPLEEFYNGVSGDVIGSPNSEKVKTSNQGGHFCALGSFYASPGHDWDTEGDGPYPTWQEKFDAILDELQFPDGGGITLNHTTDLNFRLRCEMLDYDPRVLGIEVYNHANEHRPEHGPGFYYNTIVPFWDKILSSGRRCWGFCVIDWMQEHTYPWHGRNVLVVPSITEHNALQAYRNGAFFGVVKDTGLIFSRLEAEENVIYAELTKPGTITLVTNNRRLQATGSSATFPIRDDDAFARLEASDGEGGLVFSQPIMYDVCQAKRRTRRKRWFLL